MTNMRLQEVINQVRLAKNREQSNSMGHLMGKADQLRVRLNGTEGEEASGGDENYQLTMTKHKENVAWETLGNKDAQLRGMMARGSASCWPTLARGSASCRPPLARGWRAAATSWGEIH